MTEFAVLCPADGRVVVPADGVTLVLGNGPGQHFYQFTCPTCGELRARPASGAVVAAICGTEANVERVDPPLSSEEADEFADWLERHNYVAAWAKGARDGSNAER